MIIVFVGCSFTYGDELWEEYSCVDYKFMNLSKAKKFIKEEKKSQRKKFRLDVVWDELLKDIVNSNLSLTEKINLISDNRKELAFLSKSYSDFLKHKENIRMSLGFPHHLAEKFECKYINLGKRGSSNIDSLSRGVQEISRLQKISDEKIICIMQCTEKSRLWLDNGFGKTDSLTVSGISKFNPQDKSILESVCSKYIDDYQMEQNYMFQILAMKNFCLSRNVDFYYFDVIDSDMPKLDCYLGNMITHLKNILYEDNFFLPFGHINSKAHKSVGLWLHMRICEKKILQP